MTDVDTSAVESPETDKQDKPKWWAIYPLHGRDIHFNPPSPEQLMVMRRMAKEMDTENVGRAIVSMGKVLDAVSACMSTDEERDFVDDLVMSRVVGMDELAPMVKAALLGPNKDKAPKNGPKRARRRS